MRNILVVQLETKVALTIIAIAGIIFLITIFKAVDNFNEFINHFNIK